MRRWSLTFPHARVPILCIDDFVITIPIMLVIVLVIVIVIVIVATITMVIVSAHQPTSASLYFVPARQVPWTQDCPY